MAKTKTPDATESLAKANKALAAGKLDIAVFWLKLWAQAGANGPALLREMAREARASRDWVRAEVGLRASAELVKNLDVLSELAAIKEKRGDRRGALEVYANILSEAPGATAVLMRMATLSAGLGMAEQALGFSEQV